MFQHTDLYEVSKDYTRLFELILQGFRVVCFVNYNDKAKFRDIAVYKGIQKYCQTWELTARGICYTQFDPEIDTKEDFLKDCERINLEYIDQTTKEEFKELSKHIVSGRLSSIKKGDTLIIKDNRDCEINDCVNVYEVTKEDEKSFLAGDSICGWWFYKDSLNPYSGDVTIIGILNDRC